MHPLASDTLRVLDRIITVIFCDILPVGSILMLVMPLCARSPETDEGAWS